jgi:hypothetical protein
MAVRISLREENSATIYLLSDMSDVQEMKAGDVQMMPESVRRQSSILSKLASSAHCGCFPYC